MILGLLLTGERLDVTFCDSSSSINPSSLVLPSGAFNWSFFVIFSLCTRTEKQSFLPVTALVLHSQFSSCALSAVIMSLRACCAAFTSCQYNANSYT